MKKETAKEALELHNKWRRGAEIEPTHPMVLGAAIDVAVKNLSELTLKEAYEILKKNTKYSSGTCPGFVYLSQIEELLK